MFSSRTRRTGDQMVVQELRDSAGERALVVAARAGSASAFALLVERYYAPLLRTLSRLCGDPELAADLTQDTFEVAFHSLDRLASDERFVPWLYGIARNRWRAAERRRRLRRFIAFSWLSARELDAHPALQAADMANWVVEQDAVQRALDELRPADREVLLLQAVWGFACVEIAAILGIAQAAARQRLARAKARFRRQYRALTSDDKERARSVDSLL